ncbi:MAG: hypothetical protein M5U34_13385 [Chloroflexi bacterium]|nr:hypothetical protein [Chloroflexota bacterium]
MLVLGLLGFLAGLILAPYFTTRPLRYITHRLSAMPPERLTAVIIGLFLGLVAAALLTLPLSLLPTPFGQIMPLIAAFVFCYLSVVILVSRQADLQAIIKNYRIAGSSAKSDPVIVEEKESRILLDTSVIIDGRILDISKTGFIRATLLIPNFILLELQIYRRQRRPHAPAARPTRPGNFIRPAKRFARPHQNNRHGRKRSPRKQIPN